MAYIPIQGLSQEKKKGGYIPIEGIPAGKSDTPVAVQELPVSTPTKTSTNNFGPDQINSYPVGGYVEAGGYGASFKMDASNLKTNAGKSVQSRPLLSLTNPQGTILPDRVATKFDPTVPQKLTRDILSNGRIPEEVSNAIRSELGMGIDEQLDHSISLQLSGSDQRGNLKPVKENSKGVQPLVGLENELGKKVVDGKISLIDAQRQLATAKGITLPEDTANPKATASKYIPIPGLTDLNAKSKGLQDFGVKGNPSIGQKIQDKVSGFIANLAPVKTIAGIAGGQKPLEAIKSNYGNQEQQVLDAVEVNKIYKNLLAEGVPQDKAIFQARLQVANTFSAKSAKDLVVGSLGAAESEAANLAKKAIGFDATKYVAEQTAARDVARTAETPGLIGKAKNFLAVVKSKLVDSNAPIEDVLNATLKKNDIKLLPSEHITNQIDRVLRAPTIAGQFAQDNGLESVIKNVPDLNALDQYLIARHAVTVEGAGIKTGRDLVKDALLIKELGTTYQPFAKQVTDYSRKLLGYSVDSGLVSSELATKLKEAYPDYVPLNRVFNELEKTGGNFGGGKAVASLSKQTVVQKLVGSERQIESPIESLLSKTNDAFRQGEKNVAAKLLVGYKDLPGNPFLLRELKPGESAVSTISYLDNGIKKTYETTKAISEAAKALNVQQLNILGKILAAPVRIAKVGITGINIPFVATNVVKDQISAFINSERSLATSVANPKNFVKSLFAALGHGELYQEVVREGAGGTSFDIARNQVAKTVESIRAGRSIGSRILYTAKHPSELFRAVENIVARSEELTRIQQYQGTKASLIKEGMKEAEAKIAASKAARENTVNFARHGEWGPVLNSAFLYLNAGIQGSRTLVRNLAERPIATTAKIVSDVFLPQVTATAWNMSDPERRAAYNDISDFEKKNNIIIIPPNPTKDAQGRWNVIKIPLSQEINNLSNIPRIMMERAMGGDKIKAQDIASSLIGTVSPINPDKGSILSGLTPQAIKPTLEESTNKNFFTGGDIVPQSLSKLSPELQAKDNTSGSARLLGKGLGVSPLKVESFIKETFGGLGSQVLNALDNVFAKTGVIPKDQIGGESTLSATLRRFNKAQGGETQYSQDNQFYTDQQKVTDAAFLLKQRIKPIYNHIQELVAAGKTAEATAITKGMSPEEYKAYKGLKQSDTTKLVDTEEKALYPTYLQIQDLISQGMINEAKAITSKMSPEEYKIYKKLKTKFQ